MTSDGNRRSQNGYRRILVFCAGSAVFGTEQIALSLMDGLKSRGHYVRCVCTAWSDGRFAAGLRERGIEFEEVFLGKITKRIHPRYIWWMVNTLMHLPKARRTTKRVIDEFDPEIIVLFNSDTIVLLRNLLREHRCVFHVHGLDSRNRLRSAAYRYMDGVVSKYVAVSEYVRDELVSRGVSGEKVRVIYNGVEVPGEEDLPKRGEEYIGPIRIGIVGQIGRWKGHLIFVDALARLEEEGLSVEGHIFGSGTTEFSAKVKRTIDDLKLNHEVKWHGYVSKVSEIYSTLDVVVMPTESYEPFGLIACEAGGRGLPSVVSNRGGLPEVVDDGVSGFTFDLDAPSGLADKLKILVSDPCLRQKMGRNARGRVQQRFSKARMVKDFEALFRELASG